MKRYIAGARRPLGARLQPAPPGNPKEVSCHGVSPRHAGASLVRTGGTALSLVWASEEAVGPGGRDAARVAALAAGTSALSAATQRASNSTTCGRSRVRRARSPGPNDQHLTLRLVGVRDYLTRFTDRPVRKAYVVANVDFVRRFNSYFAGSKPNAVLSYSLRGKAIPTAVVLGLGQPRWDPKTASLTFPARRIPHMEDDMPDTTVHIKPPFIPNPRHFDKAGLFIDSGCGASATAITAVIC